MHVSQQKVRVKSSEEHTMLFVVIVMLLCFIYSEGNISITILIHSDLKLTYTKANGSDVAILYMSNNVFSSTTAVTPSMCRGPYNS